MQAIFPEIKIEAAKSNTKLLVVKSKTPILEEGKSLYNVYIDEDRKFIHFYDDLNHHTESIVSTIDNDFIKEFASLIGINYKLYRYVIYYSPIKRHPFVLEYDVSKEVFKKNSSIDCMKQFYQMAKNGHKIYE